MDTISKLEDGEWTSSKKVVNHKTRQVETRIKRQLIMEDGKVIADSGPQVTIRTKEDAWTEESENSAKKGLPEDIKSIGSAIQSKPSVSSSPLTTTTTTATTSNSSVPRSGKIVVTSNTTSNGDGDKVICEKIETKNTIREAKHERFQYHDESISELTGFDIHQKALISPNDLITINCGAIDINAKDDDIDLIFNGTSNNLPPKGKLTHYSSKSHKTTDREEIKETSKLGPDGEITKETVRTSHHEEISDDEEPDKEGEEEEESEKEKKITLIDGNQKKENTNFQQQQQHSSTSKITYSSDIPNPITSLPNQPKPNQQITHHIHHRHLNGNHPIYEIIAGKVDHTNKWIENHFGSSDSGKHSDGDIKEVESGLNSSSNGFMSLSPSSVVDRRGRPRQRIDPDLSQSHDEAYYSNITIGTSSGTSGVGGGSSGLVDQSKNLPSKAANDKLDSPPSISPLLLSISKKYKQQLNKQQRQSNKNGDLNGNISTTTPPTTITGSGYSNDSTSESSFINYVHDYHHSSEGSLSPSALTQHQLQHHHHQSKNNPLKSLHTGQWPSKCDLNSNSKPPKSFSQNNNVNNNSRNVVIKVKSRGLKEDASVQASLSDEETFNYGDDCRNETIFGKQSANPVNRGSMDSNNVNRSRPIRTYYFGESLPSDSAIVNQGSSSSNRDSRDYRLSSRLPPVNDLIRSTNQSFQSSNQNINSTSRDFFIEQFNVRDNLDYENDEKYSKSLNCLNERKAVNGSADKLYDLTSRTDLFQTRDYGSLSNWRSTINLRSNGLTTIDGPLYRNHPKDDSFTHNYDGCRNYIHEKPNYRDSLNRIRLRKGRLTGPVTNMIDGQLKMETLSDFEAQGLSSIKGRKLPFENNYLLLPSSERETNNWPEINSLKVSPINNAKGTFKVNYKHRTPISRTFFKVH